MPLDSAAHLNLFRCHYAARAAVLLVFGVSGSVYSAENPAVETATAAPQSLYISEYRVIGAEAFPRVQLDEAVYPFLGPGRTTDDVESARAALEKAYHDAGYQAASVEVPEQTGRGGIIYLKVGEGRVGKLRVKGARFFLPSRIKAAAPSLAEGRVLNFNDVQRDIVALNQWTDRQVTPSLKAGEEPGVVDVELTVVDKFPLHGSIELNNQYSASTKPLRLSASLSYSNLWQLGHIIGGSFQIAPERPDDAKVYSAFYTARIPGNDWLILTLSGTKNESDVTTLGGTTSIGRGESLGLTATISLPPLQGFYHSLSLGVEYKRAYNRTLQLERALDAADLPSDLIPSNPIVYFPVSIDYNATWAGKGRLTELNAGLTFSFRGTGDDIGEYEEVRYKADGGFFYFHGELAHTQDLPKDFKAYGRVQGQISSGPLIVNEQIAGGGLNSVRGYLEAEVQGDNGIFGTFELRSPSLLGWWKKPGNEWRVYGFIEGGIVTLEETLPEQEGRFELASIGVGSRLQFLDHLNGSVDLGLPLIGTDNTDVGDLFLSFRVWADF